MYVYRKNEVEDIEDVFQQLVVTYMKSSAITNARVHLRGNSLCPHPSMQSDFVNNNNEEKEGQRLRRCTYMHVLCFRHAPATSDFAKKNV